MTDIATSISVFSDYAELRLVASIIKDLKERVNGLESALERKEELLTNLSIAEASAMLLIYEIALETSPKAKTAVNQYIQTEGIVSGTGP